MISVTIPRTRPAARPRKTPAPAAISPKRLARMFPIARELVEASSQARRAAVLLRVPDAIVLSHGDVLAAACRSCGFAMGAMFLDQRSAVLHARRGPDGRVPRHFIDTLEIWLGGMAELASREDPQ